MPLVLATISNEKKPLCNRVHAFYSLLPVPVSTHQYHGDISAFYLHESFESHISWVWSYCRSNLSIFIQCIISWFLWKVTPVSLQNLEGFTTWLFHYFLTQVLIFFKWFRKNQYLFAQHCNLNNSLSSLHFSTVQSLIAYNALLDIFNWLKFS